MMRCPARLENDSLHFYGVSFSWKMMGGDQMAVPTNCVAALSWKGLVWINSVHAWMLIVIMAARVWDVTCLPVWCNHWLSKILSLTHHNTTANTFISINLLIEDKSKRSLVPDSDEFCRWKPHLFSKFHPTCLKAVSLKENSLKTWKRKMMYPESIPDKVKIFKPQNFSLQLFHYIIDSCGIKNKFISLLEIVSQQKSRFF